MREPDAEQLQDALAALREDMASLEAPAEVEARLLAAYRRRRPRAWWTRPWVYGAIAAMLLVGAAGWAWSVLRQPLPQLTEHPVLQPPSQRDYPPPPPREERPAARVTARAAVTPPAAPATRIKPARPPEPPAREVATEFIPVQAGAAYERGRLIRVRVPRPALSNFGLPFDEDRAAEPVKADVVVGEDGLVRAIRFVQP